jgi:hypothetical protein
MWRSLKKETRSGLNKLIKIEILLKDNNHKDHEVEDEVALVVDQEVDILVDQEVVTLVTDEVLHDIEAVQMLLQDENDSHLDLQMHHVLVLTLQIKTTQDLLRQDEKLVDEATLVTLRTNIRQELNDEIEMVQEVDLENQDKNSPA